MTTAPASRFGFGDVVLVPFPFTDQSGAKKRPAVVVSSSGYNVSVWPRHLELSRMPLEHRIHGEAGGGDMHGGDGVDGALAERRHVGRLDRGQSVCALVDTPRWRALPGFSRCVATDAAATPRSGCSTAWAAA
jgi:hypothetical protein